MTMMTVWTHEVDGYMVTIYTNASEGTITALNKDTLNRTHIRNRTGPSFDIPMEPDGEPVDDYQPMKTISYTRWTDIQKAKQDERELAEREAMRAERLAARKAAAAELQAALTAGKIGLDPRTDRIIISDRVVTDLEEGAVDRDGEVISVVTRVR